MNKETRPISSEQIPDIDSSDWDTLVNAPNKVFNKIDEVKDIDSLKGAELQNKEVDQTETQLKNTLIDSNEKFTRGERIACDNLADELNHSHFESLSRTVQEFGAYSSRLDSERFDTLLEYLDQKFSTELNPEDKKRITDELRDTYFRDTAARAGLLAEESDNVWSNLNQMNSKVLEKPIHHVDKFRKEAPQYQVQIAKAYFDYFDEPTDKSRTHLTHKVEDYLHLIRHEFGSISQDLIDHKIGTKDLPDALFLGLSQATSRNYEEIHDALMKYYDYKVENDINTNLQSLEASTESPEDIDLDNQPPSSLPSDIF